MHRPHWVLWAPSHLLKTLLKFQETSWNTGIINLKRKSHNEVGIKCLRKALSTDLLSAVEKFMNLPISIDIYPTSKCVGGLGGRGVKIRYIITPQCHLLVYIASSRLLCKFLRILNLILQTGKLRPRGGCVLPEFVWQGRPEARCAGSAPGYISFFGTTPSSPSRAVSGSNAIVFTPGIVIRVAASLSLLRFTESIFAPSNILLT